MKRRKGPASKAWIRALADELLGCAVHTDDLADWLAPGVLRIFWDLTQAGFTVEHAVEGLCLFPRHPSMTLHQRRDLMLEYLHAGVPAEDVVDWVRSDATAQQAAAYAASGWTFKLALQCMRYTPGGEPVTAWMSAPLRADDALTYAAAGLSLGEALEQEAERPAGASIAEQIRMLAALRRADA